MQPLSRSLERVVSALAPWRRQGSEGRRRLDWLVLLPTVETARPSIAVIGSVSQDDRRRIAAHFSTDAVLDAEDSALADVVVALEADAAETVRALARLDPSGVAFITTSKHRDRRDVFRSVDSTGRSVVAVSAHWLVPSVVAPRRFIPLGSVGPLRWYLRNLFAGGSAPVRLLARLVSHFASQVPHLMRSQALVVAGSEQRAARSELIEVASAALDGSEVTEAIVVTSGFDAGSRSVVLAFERGAAAPRAVVKVAADLSLNHLTRNEQTALRELRADLPPALAVTVPSPMGDVEWRGRSVGVESAFDGPTLAVSMIERRAPGDHIRRLHQVAAWLSELHEATRRPGRWDDDAHERWILGTTSRARSELRLIDSTQHFFDRLEAASRSLIGLELPTVRRHFDLGPWNIIVAGENLGVIDWESGRSRSSGGYGPPLCDLEFFVKYWLHAAVRTRDLDDELGLFHWFDEGHDGRTKELLQAAGSAIATHCDSLSIDRRFVPVLGAHQWIEQAVDGANRTTALGGDVARPNAAHEYLRVLAGGLRFDSM